MSIQEEVLGLVAIHYYEAALSASQRTCQDLTVLNEATMKKFEALSTRYHRALHEIEDLHVTVIELELQQETLKDVLHHIFRVMPMLQARYESMLLNPYSRESRLLSE